jgi:ketosteroid isomerase-like protein
MPIPAIRIPFVILAVGGTLAQATTTAQQDASFQAFLPRFERATERFINGDPTLWKEIASRRDDATIMGAWGAFEQGWNEVGPRYDWAAARFKPSGAQLKVEYLTSSVSGDLAYTVAIERSTALIVGQDQPAPLTLRVTHVFRQENGVWRLMHRQADPLINKTAPGAVVQK